MDRSRRRFIPSSEGLEGRQLLSTTSVPATPAAVLTPNPNGPFNSPPSAPTIESKLHRVQNLPFFIGQLNRDGAVPQPTVENIQNDLTSLVASLAPGNSSASSAFNLDLRKTQPYLKIRPQDATALNRDFGTVLLAAGAKPAVVSDLQTQMTDLTNFATTQPDSRIVATEAYAIVGEIALEIGRPLAAPLVPSLLGADHQGNKGKVQITHNSQPSLTGSHISGTNVQIVNFNDQTVLGTAEVNPTTQVYTVKFNGKLPDGIYTVRVRAEDSGYVSPPSPPFTFEVITPKPNTK
jgi:Bacterial Ig-like domain